MLFSQQNSAGDLTKASLFSTGQPPLPSTCPFGSQHGLLPRGQTERGWACGRSAVLHSPGCRAEVLLHPSSGRVPTGLAQLGQSRQPAHGRAQRGVCAGRMGGTPYFSGTGSARSWTRRCGWCQHRTGGRFQRSLVVLEGQEGQVDPGLQRGTSIPHLEREELFSDSERTRKSHMPGNKFKGSNPNFHPFPADVDVIFLFKWPCSQQAVRAPSKLNLSLSPPSIYKQNLPPSCEKRKCFTL